MINTEDKRIRLASLPPLVKPINGGGDRPTDRPLNEQLEQREFNGLLLRELLSCLTLSLTASRAWPKLGTRSAASYKRNEGENVASSFFLSFFQTIRCPCNRNAVSPSGGTVTWFSFVSRAQVSYSSFSSSEKSLINLSMRLVLQLARLKKSLAKSELLTPSLLNYVLFRDLVVSAEQVVSLEEDSIVVSKAQAVVRKVARETNDAEEARKYKVIELC